MIKTLWLRAGAVKTCVLFVCVMKWYLLQLTMLYCYCTWIYQCMVIIIHVKQYSCDKRQFSEKSEWQWILLMWPNPAKCSSVRWFLEVLIFNRKYHRKYQVEYCIWWMVYHCAKFSLQYGGEKANYCKGCKIWMKITFLYIVALCHIL